MLLALVTVMAIKKEWWTSFDRESYRLDDRVFLKTWCTCCRCRKRADLAGHERILIDGIGLAK